ncbi:hypothetical protein TRP8649_02296 [Pelagimonas phthalicica]|uniref:Uncharacterized protein n=1 Tax=Pelagimonas phthalicica TaxID=1037362 RepID=A0A238JBU4_9RHOB|nr:hypothetical protein [Pelagimonas phthalicica]TDS91134.1 hypothetical protein CLV87_2298 [Pelagimonas phthalicica]SMX28181.1 hypothetical protein TRP8649_02296 [Pelagimonas phthalicica]
MPIARRILPEFGLTFVRYFGDVTVKENLDCFLGYIDDPQFDPNFHVLVDQESCTLSEATYSEMRRLAYCLLPYYKARGRASRTALYGPTDVQFGISRLYESVSETYVDRDVGVFRTQEEALAYLGYDPEDQELFDTLWQSALQFKSGT